MTSDATPVRVVLLEDHAPTRAALRARLASFPERVAVVAEFDDPAVFLRDVQRDAATLKVAVALIDLKLPGMTGARVIEKLAVISPEARAVALTAFAEENDVIDAITAGAFGYLTKDEPIERLVSAIEEAAAGGHPISSRVAGFLISRVVRMSSPVALSAREQELAEGLADGFTYAECATSMGVALGTVQEYVKRLYRKLDVSSRSEVRAWVQRNAALR